MKKYLAVILATLMFVAAFAGCAQKNEEEAYGIFRDYVNASITTLNLRVNSDAFASVKPMTTTLYRDFLNEDGTAYETLPMLAADFPQQMDEEGKVWRIPIRQDYYWADYGPT